MNKILIINRISNRKRLFVIRIIQLNFAQQSEQTHSLLFDGGKKAAICANKRLLIGEKA